MKIKSEIFKTAWTIFKKEAISFSQALMKAWELSKEATFRIRKDYMGTPVEEFWVITQKGSVTEGKLHNLYLSLIIANSCDYDSAAKAQYYGCGKYNGD